MTELEKVFVTVAGVAFACVGLLLNAYVTIKNMRSRKLSNYQEIIKSHREIWKLALDKPEKYGRVLLVNPNLSDTPITEAERRFVNLLLLHVTSAFYFRETQRHRHR